MSGFNRLDGRTAAGHTKMPHFGISKHDLERDSGFSDASSEYLSAVEVTDSEDAGRNGSAVGQEQTGQHVAVVGGSYPGMSPMIIMNNFVLKQPSPIAPADKQWSFSSPLEVMPQSQVVLLQPMVSNGRNSSPKTGSENVRQSKSYMPILKSYPRIAPHPADPPTKRGGSHRVRAGYDQRQRRHHHGHRPYSSPGPPPALQSPARALSGFEAATDPTQAAESQKQQESPGRSPTPPAGPSSLSVYSDEFSILTDDIMPSDKTEDAISMHSNKLKRFSNTYNILNKSGLLGITMRTKQLIKENKRTQGQLHQLQEQTALLLEAVSSGDPQLWTKLHLSLQDTDKDHWAAKAQTVQA
ncbi:unnamed protein product [Menidia menidia]|uniref:(Atlantic silverside) hypothetical protein n=1 Tax=Menidia menidia TaxID=238744 RepID=A0A8S4AEJ2_9TELE|nr:unnamed protein product [Menidia menidia]